MDKKDLITDDLLKNTNRGPIFTPNMVRIILSWVADESIRDMNVEWIDLSILNACTDVIGHYLTNRDMDWGRNHIFGHHEWKPVATRTTPAFARALLNPDTTANDRDVISFQNAIQQVAFLDNVEKSPRRAAAVTAVLYAGMLRAAAQLDDDNAAHAEKVVSGLGLAFIALNIVIGIAPIPSQAKEFKAYLDPLQAHLVKMEQGKYVSGQLALVLKKILHDAIFLKARHGEHVPGFQDAKERPRKHEQRTRQVVGEKFEYLTIKHLNDLGVEWSA
ncbi:hypothetical protein FOVG_19999 [Fusarium oxysporum f. sp. pisi HDV247]|uniref:Uncharacterized protein n=1 Tax=Fusarium oxysporum f. sp. pisi HDV247 TaxID=1080344 RepID=W9NKK4_FUSOX|nr:hypothetical protein FOVG_19999 [Fusarium oxysporum f. sp. pisi HDV247]